MVFYYQGDEYVIGGYSNGSFSAQDIEVAKNGIWLPEASQLLLWLVDTHFRVTVTTDEENLCEVQAVDSMTDSVYHGSDLTLANALAVVIRKICKSKKCAYIPEQRLMLEIITPKDE